MSENDVVTVLRAIAEFQKTVENKMDKVFYLIENVESRVGELETDKAVRDERRHLERELETKRVNWAQVRTLSTVAASGFLIAAAVKFLLTNLDKWIP